MKIPHRPERYVGRWAVSLGHELLRIESVGRDPDGCAVYHGTGIRGQKVWTRVATVLPQADHERLEQLT